MPNPGIFLSFAGGMISIFSPCILPILPSFIGYIGGISLSQAYSMLEKKRLRKLLFLDTVLFCLGFSIIFLLFGAVIGFLGEALIFNKPLLEKIAGAIIIIFGLQLTGLIQIKSLLKEKHIEIPKPLSHIKHLRSLLLGMSFSFSWAPCYGPVVGSIFTLAATQADFQQSILLFFFYSLGFLTPLLIFTLFLSQATTFIKKHQKILRYSPIMAGSMMIVFGILLLTNNTGTLINSINSLYNQNNIQIL